MKRLLTAIIFALTLTTSLAQAASSEPHVTATSAILVEASTGRILYEKNANEELPPACRVRLMSKNFFGS